MNEESIRESSITYGSFKLWANYSDVRGCNRVGSWGCIGNRNVVDEG